MNLKELTLKLDELIEYLEKVEVFYILPESKSTELKVYKEVRSWIE